VQIKLKKKENWKNCFDFQFVISLRGVFSRFHFTRIENCLVIGKLAKDNDLTGVGGVREIEKLSKNKTLNKLDEFSISTRIFIFLFLL
jgi:hypothetical protein